MKITAMITDNNVLNSKEAEKTLVIKETLSRPKQGSDINRSLASNDVHISGRALLYSRIREVINSLPDVREDKIASIGNEMLLGEYNVSAEQTAAKLLREHILDALSGE